MLHRWRSSASYVYSHSGRLRRCVHVIGHKGPSATMFCLWYDRTKAFSAVDPRLDVRYRTLQGDDGAKHLRLSSVVLDRQAANKWPGPLPREQHGSKHMSIERNASHAKGPPESSDDSLHITLGGLSALMCCGC